MATHSSTLAWKILWMKEPGRLQSMGLLRVGHDRVTSLSLFPFMHWRRKWQPTPLFLPGESQGQGSLVGCPLWGCTESDTTEVTQQQQQQQQLIRILLVFDFLKFYCSDSFRHEFVFVCPKWILGCSLRLRMPQVIFFFNPGKSQPFSLTTLGLPHSCYFILELLSSIYQSPSSCFTCLNFSCFSLPHSRSVPQVCVSIYTLFFCMYLYCCSTS